MFDCVLPGSFGLLDRVHLILGRSEIKFSVVWIPLSAILIDIVPPNVISRYVQ